jgi:hypothetical protein
MRWASVEWGTAVARVYQARATPLLREYGIRVVLPDLPSSAILSSELRSEFLATIPPSHRIQTICASRFDSPQALQHHVQHDLHANHVLVVGGNDKDQNTHRMSSVDAILALSQWTSSIENSQSLTVWGVANPNCPSSIDSVRAKIEAGATGIITQPLWTARAVDRVHQYAAIAHNISLVAGMAYPTSLRSLDFWHRLLVQHSGMTTLRGDAVLEAHYRYFAAPNASATAWALEQAMLLSELTFLEGLHSMPLHNARDWWETVLQKRHWLESGE